jgi:hypothetical protein
VRWRAFEERGLLVQNGRILKIPCITFPDRGALIRDADQGVGGWAGWELDFDSFGFCLHMHVRRGGGDKPYNQRCAKAVAPEFFKRMR